MGIQGRVLNLCSSGTVDLNYVLDLFIDVSILVCFRCQGHSLAKSSLPTV